MTLPTSGDLLLTRDDVAKALTEAGFPISAKTLATKATRGGGPPYRRFGRKPLYRWADAIRWAESRLSDPCLNTSSGHAVVTGSLAAGAASVGTDVDAPDRTSDLKIDA